MSKKQFLTSFLLGILMCIATFSYAVTYSPYFDMSLGGQDTGPDNITKIAGDAKIKAITVAFVVGLSDSQTSGQGYAYWGGYSSYSVNKGWGVKEIQAFQKLGGIVTVSFGGAAAASEGGHYLCETCLDVKTLVAEYKKVIDTYKVTRLDYDVEVSFLNSMDSTTMASRERMGQAIAILQKENPKLVIGFTLPVMPYGLTPTGIKFVNAMQALDVRIDYINIMAMDYGTGVSEMGKAAVSATTNTAKQLKLDHSQIAITPMIGVNDTSSGKPLSEVFTLADAVEVHSFSGTYNPAFIGSWSLNRDHGESVGMPVVNTSSGILQADYAFASAFQTGKYPPAPPPPDVSVRVVNEINPKTYCYPSIVYIDGKKSTMNNYSFKINSGTHTLGFTIGSEVANCKPYTFKKNQIISIQLLSYKWGSHIIDCNFKVSAGVL